MTTDVFGSGGDGVERLQTHLRALASQDTEADLLRSVREVCRSLVAANDVRLITRDAAYHFLRRMGVHADRGGPPELRAMLANGPAERWLEAGEVLGLSRDELDGLMLGLAGDNTRAVFVPCAGAGSQSGLLLIWGEGAGEMSAAERAAIGCVAAMAAAVFARIAARGQAGTLRGSIENRVRNLIAVIRSVGGRSAERAASLEDFMLHFEGRIDALARSQISLTRGGPVSIADLVREELIAQNLPEGDALVLEDGGDFALTADQAEALSLAVHELAVNSVKFGAFSDAGGRLTVGWRVVADPASELGWLRVDWQEQAPAGVVVTQPERSGFGLLVLNRVLPFQIQAKTALDFGPGGLACRIELPLKI